MIIGIDFNNTIQNQIMQICISARLKFGATITLADFDRWDPPIGQKVGIPNDEFTAWAWGSKLVQQMAKPFPGAREVINALHPFHRIHVITSTKHPDLVPRWMFRHGINYHHIIHVQDKNEAGWDVLIDDDPKALSQLFGIRPVIRFALPWNRHLIHIPTLYGWHDGSLEVITGVLHREEVPA